MASLFLGVGLLSNCREGVGGSFVDDVVSCKSDGLEFLVDAGCLVDNTWQFYFFLFPLPDTCRKSLDHGKGLSCGKGDAGGCHDEYFLSLSLSFNVAWGYSIFISLFFWITAVLELTWGMTHGTLWFWWCEYLAVI